MKNYELSDFTWVTMVALGFLLYLMGVMPGTMLPEYFITTAILCGFELTAFMLWAGTGLYDPTCDHIKPDEECKIVPMDYVKLLLGMRL